MLMNKVEHGSMITTVFQIKIQNAQQQVSLQEDFFVNHNKPLIGCRIYWMLSLPVQHTEGHLMTTTQTVSHCT